MIYKAVKMKKDNGMQWILALEECEKNEDNQEYFVEYEICSEARIPAVLEYGNGFLQCHIFQELDEKGLYTYLVRIKHIQKEYKFDWSSYSKKGYYFENGLIGEILAIFSVYFQARFYLKAQITGDLKFRQRSEYNFQYKRSASFSNFEMFSKQDRYWAEKGGGVSLFLDKIRTINEDYHQNLIQSFFWYTEAIKEIGTDPQLFFIKMVSSAEALLRFIKISPDALEEKINKVIEVGFTKKEADEIKNWFKNRKIGQRFLIFFQKYSTGFFKGGKKRASHCFIKKPELKENVRRIYRARSKYLHEGKNMYVSSDLRGDDAKFYDKDPSRGMFIDRRNIPEGEKLPRTRWFERITNHCLKNFVEELSQSTK